MKRAKKMVLSGLLAISLMASTVVPAFASNITIPTVSQPTSATYRITTTVSNGTIDPGMDVAGNTNKTINYKANDGYKLKSLKVDGVFVSVKNYPTSYTFTQVKDNHRVEAVFAKDGETNMKNIALSVVNGTIDKSEAVSNGGNKVVKFQPTAGYQLAKVMLDGAEVPKAQWTPFLGGSYSFTNVTKDRSLQVIYEKSNGTTDTYTITTKVTNGKIDVSKTVSKNGSKTITYSGLSGYHLAKIEIDGSALSAEEMKNNANSYTFSDVTKDHNISVYYEADKDAIKDYEIKVTAKNGKINDDKSEVNLTVKKGESTKVTYTPDAGYRLKSLILNDKPLDIATYKDSYTFTNVDANQVLKVEFEKVPGNAATYTIKTSVVNGTITGNATVNEGEAKTIEYSPKSGYVLKSVKVDGKEVSIKDYPNKYAFTNVKENHEIAVEYKTKVVASTVGKGNKAATARQGSNAKTGDHTNIALYVLLAGLSFGVIAGTVLRRKKNK